MKTITELCDDYIDLQKRLYRRNFQSHTRSYIRGFAKYLEQKFGTVSAPKPKAGSFRPSNGRRVALISEEIGSMTGGRYYAWFIALALVELGYDVTVYTTQTPSYFEFFKEYKQPSVVIIDSKPALENLDVEADIYISSPLIGNLAVTKLSEKYNKPCFVMVFDPIPMMKEYTTPYTGWEESIKRIRATNVNLLTLCKSTSEYTYEWLNKTKDKVFPIYPCINSKELAKVGDCQREDYVVFVSRLVRHKKFEDVLLAVKEARVRLKVISSVVGVAQLRMVKNMHMGDQVEFITHANDERKFDVIKHSLAVINGSNFEGFGMWAAEAVATGTPLVCYELPTIIEIRDFAKAKNFYLAKFNDPEDLTRKLKQCLEEGKFKKESHIFDFEVMIQSLKKLFHYEPQIGVVTIALNEEEFIGASLSSVIRHPSVKKVAVVEGAVKLFEHAANGNGLSKDKTMLEVVSAMKKENGSKIIYDCYGWAEDKSELRNRALELLQGVDYILVVDADEIWGQEELDELIKTIKEHPQADIIKFHFYHFYKSIKQIAVGGQWNSMLFRCFKYVDKSLHWKDHEKVVVDGEGVSLSDSNMVVAERIRVYHLGYMKSKQNVLDKLAYYKKRDKRLPVDENIYLDWEKGKPTSATHGNGDVEEFNGTYPDEVLELIHNKKL